MTDPQPHHDPAQPAAAPRGSKRALVWFAVVAVVAIAAAVVAVLVGTSAEDPPEAMTRAALMARYAELSPLDKSATPEVVDELAKVLCQRLAAGTTVDTLITNATDSYRSHATEVVKLFVGYKCPEHLKDFK